jgi:2-deoxy-D-gluconate 3-dehydrogenase
MSPFDLTGKVAIVTGANTGLGQAIAEALATAGADIVAVGRTPPVDTRFAVEALGRRFHDIAADRLHDGADRRGSWPRPSSTSAGSTSW